jgi:23S rRNA pseudouridine2605 synthase
MLVISLVHVLPVVLAMVATPPEQKLVRLDKLLAERGAGSRKDVDRMIRKGLVEVDGQVVGKSGAKLKVPWSCSPIVDGFDYPPPPLLAAYHKPLGVVSSMRDDLGRSDLSSVLPLAWQKSLHPVGRLDADTTGLLLFSRSGDLTHRLLHPKYVVEREYLAEVENPIDPTSLAQKLADGVETLEEGAPLVVCAKLLEVTGQTVRLTVTEGKYRMVRRVLANCGHPGESAPFRPSASHAARHSTTKPYIVASLSPGA